MGNYLIAAILAVAAGLGLAWVLHLGWQALEVFFTLLRHV